MINNVWVDRIEDIRKVFAANLTDAEFDFFKGLGAATGLNPFRKEIWVVKYGSQAAQVFVGRDGYRIIALNHADYDYHQCDCVYENDSFEVISGEVHHRYSLKDRGKIMGAYCITKRKSSSKPVYHFVKFSEYNTGKSLWISKPETMIKKCFDENTEVLTDEGFQKFSHVTGKIMQMTENGVQVTDAIPFCQDYSGDMLLYDTNRLNFCVTPNHNMITSEGEKEASLMFEKANKCRRIADKIPYNYVVENEDYPGISDNQIKLAGFFIADGWKNRGNLFHISVSREKKIDALDDLEMHHSKSIRLGAGNVSLSKGRKITTLSDYMCYKYDFKHIEQLCNQDGTFKKENILKLSQRQAKILIDAWCFFDGSERKSGAKRLFSSNLELIKTAELIAVMAGYAVSMIKQRISDISSKPGYNINIVPSRQQQIVSHIESRLVFQKIKNPTNKVWCVTVPSGKIIVRRFGFSMICGNCAEAHGLRASFHDILGGTYIPEEVPEEMSQIQLHQPPEQIQLHESSEQIKLRASSEQINTINTLIADKNIDNERIKKALGFFKVDKIDNLLEDQAKKIIERFKES